MRSSVTFDDLNFSDFLHTTAEDISLSFQNNSNLKVNKKKRTMKHGAIIFNIMVIQQVLA